MTLLSRKVDYAILILTYLMQRPGSWPSAREIASQLGLSRSFAANILKDLGAAEFVASARGSKGGYELAKTPEEINLADLFEVLGGPFHLTECNMPHKEEGEACDLLRECPVRRPMARVHDRIRQVLRDVTLAEINEPAEPVTPEGVRPS